MQIDAKKLNEALHKVPEMITLFKKGEEMAAEIRELLMKAIETEGKDDE